MIFVDTSAFFALADRADEEHESARALYGALLAANSALTTHSYVVVETAALVQRRLSARAARTFLQDMEHFPIVWVDRRLHEHGVERFASITRRGVSLVDCVPHSHVK